ncbi:hypothetical protein PVAP13_8KG241800 [Panicum virgatum]|uniref:Uncharacterized protein n=1 Tax=Panicum virgatum TaxID=38727 RepID=A0A8T0PP17_PANVG|nr:hypothetical protein PVAP13_8KG241800 [Panicum virgatum]
MVFNKKLVAAVFFTLALLLISCSAEAPSGYGKEKEGLVICFEDWVCKAFWRLRLPQPAPRRRATPYRRLAAAPRSWSGRRRDTGFFQVPPHAYA